MFNPAFITSDNERPPAQIWELLRRNNAFKTVAQQLSRLHDCLSGRSASPGDRDSALNEGKQLVDNARDKHPFASVALQWLSPDPTFTWTKTVKLGNGKTQIKTGHGLRPSPRHKSWSWTNDDEIPGEPNLYTTWGPHITKFTGDKIDPLKEWIDDEKRGWTFDSDTEWPRSPAGFRRELIHLHRQYDFRVTDRRSDVPHPHETKFFQDWNLFDLFHLGSEASEQALAKSVEFQKLKNEYRIFAVPRHIQTKTAVNKATAEINRLLKECLPKKCVEQLGNPTEWQDYLDVERIQIDNETPSTKKAIHRLIKARSKSETTMELREARRMTEKGITINFNAIKALITGIYHDS